MSEVRQRGFVAPEADRDSSWWWEAVAGGALLLPRCLSCGRASFPPGPTCPHCGHAELERVEASGRGVVHSHVVVRLALDPAFADDVPYVVVAVELEEGPRMFGRLGGDPDPVTGVPPVAEGMPVRATLYEVEGTTLVGFVAA